MIVSPLHGKSSHVSSLPLKGIISIFFSLTKLVEMECFAETLQQLRTGQIEIMISTDQTLRWLDQFPRGCVSNEGFYRGSGLFTFGWDRSRKREKGEAVVLVEGECEQELIRKQRWYRKLQVDVDGAGFGLT